MAWLQRSAGMIAAGILIALGLLFPRHMPSAIGGVAFVSGLQAVVRGRLEVGGSAVRITHTYQGAAAYIGGGLLIVFGAGVIWFTWPR
jgi:hypothetical protein